MDQIKNWMQRFSRYLHSSVVCCLLLYVPHAVCTRMLLPGNVFRSQILCTLSGVRHNRWLIFFPRSWLEGARTFLCLWVFVREQLHPPRNAGSEIVVHSAVTLAFRRLVVIAIIL